MEDTENGYYNYVKYARSLYGLTIQVASQNPYNYYKNIPVISQTPWYTKSYEELIGIIRYRITNEFNENSPLFIAAHASGWDITPSRIVSLKKSLEKDFGEDKKSWCDWITYLC